MSDSPDVDDVHALALGMPHVTVVEGPKGNAVYQVGGKSFVFFRTPRPDAADPVTGERYTDVIMFWVESEEDKDALVRDPSSPFFTTPHFDGHLSVLLRAADLPGSPARSSPRSCRTPGCRGPRTAAGSAGSPSSSADYLRFFLLPFFELRERPRHRPAPGKLSAPGSKPAGSSFMPARAGGSWLRPGVW